MDRLILTFLVFIICGAISACTAIKIPVPVSGSKSDGIVSLSYNVGAFEKPVVDFDKAIVSAKERCNAWGFKNASSFGGAKMTCNAYNGYGDCVNKNYTIDYQCMD